MFGSPGFNPSGTLRIYGKTKADILAIFSGVVGFRDLDLDYQEQVAVEEGAAIWKSDEEGYLREEKVQRRKEWVEHPELAAPPEPQIEDDDIPFEPPPKPRPRRKKTT